MNAILTNILASRAFFLLSVLIIAAMMALVVQAAMDLSAAPVVPAKYCHYRCTEVRSVLLGM